MKVISFIKFYNHNHWDNDSDGVPILIAVILSTGISEIRMK